MNEYPRAGLDLVDRSRQRARHLAVPEPAPAQRDRRPDRAEAGLPVRVPRLGHRLQGAGQLPLAHRHARRTSTTGRSRTRVRLCEARRQAPRRALARAASARFRATLERLLARARPRPRTPPPRRCSSSRPTSGPGSIPSSAISSSPRTGGAGGWARHASASAASSRASSRCASTASVRVRSPAGREPVGDRQHRHLELDRLARAHVAVHVPARQRPLVHEEAEPQVMLRQRGDVVGQRGARVQPPDHVARHAGADAVVAPEQHAALGVDRPRRRLAGVVQQRSEAQRLPARELVRQRARAARRRCAPRARRTRPPGRARSRPAARAPRACAPTRRGGGRGSAPLPSAVQLRQQMRPAARCSSTSPIPRDRVVARRPAGAARRTSAPARPRRCAGAARRASAAVRGLDLEAQLAGEARQAQHAQRVVLERALGHGAQEAAAPGPPPRRAGRPASPIVSSGRAIALTVKSRSARSASIASPRSGVRSACHERSRAITRHAPNRSESGNTCASAAVAQARAAALGRRPRRRCRRPSTGRSRNASRTGPPTSQACSPASAERAMRTAGERSMARDGIGQDGLGPAPATRGTRGEIPHVTS